MDLAAAIRSLLEPCSSRWLGLATLMLGVCVPTGVSAEGGVYTWTDERGVVHFSNSQVPERHMASA